MELPTQIVVGCYKKGGSSVESPSGQFWTKHPMSTPSSLQEEVPISPEVEEAPSSAKVEEQPSSCPMSPASATAEDLKISDEHTLSRPIFPVAATPEKIDDNTELNITEDFDNRPSKKGKKKYSESGVLEPPTMSTSNPVSECFESTLCNRIPTVNSL
ncbi:hypothetical protein ACQJBY_002265 [Aegilops geniculata]